MQDYVRSGIQDFTTEEMLRCYPVWRNRMEILEKMLRQMDALSDEEIIGQHALARSSPGGAPRAHGGASSRTEGVALRLDELRAQSAGEILRARAEAARELRLLRLYASYCEILLSTLDGPQQRLVALHFQQGHSLRRLAAGALPPRERMPGWPSKYRLQKMKREILARIDAARAENGL